MHALSLKETHCPAEIAEFRSAYFHVISPNATQYIPWVPEVLSRDASGTQGTKYAAKLNKKILQSKTEAVVKW